MGWHLLVAPTPGRDHLSDLLTRRSLTPREMSARAVRSASFTSSAKPKTLQLPRVHRKFSEPDQPQRRPTDTDPRVNFGVRTDLLATRKAVETTVRQANRARQGARR